MFELPESRDEIHAKLDALIDAEFIPLVALITQLHHEVFFRKNLPDGYEQTRLEKGLAEETAMLLSPSVSEEEFMEAMYGDRTTFQILEALVRTALQGNKEGDVRFFDRIRAQLQRDSSV